MSDKKESRRAYFSEDEIDRILEASQKQFNERRKDDYAIKDPMILEGLSEINKSADYAKVIWRVQQGHPEVEEYFDPAYLTDALTNLKMFYSLELIDGKNLHSLSKTLDVFWHAHQDFTFDYMRFCNTVFGPGQFLHHLPLDKRSEKQQEVIRRRYDYTRTVLDKIYAVDRTFWGEGVAICCSYEASNPAEFVYWQPALNAIEPACNLYNEAAVNEEIQKRTNFVLKGFAEMA